MAGKCRCEDCSQWAECIFCLLNEITLIIAVFYKANVKKREESRLRFGLGPWYENGEIIYKGGKHLGKSCFMTKINSSVLDMISLSYFTTKWRHLNK